MSMFTNNMQIVLTKCQKSMFTMYFHTYIIPESLMFKLIVV